jgi:hypothetical protein
MSKNCGNAPAMQAKKSYTVLTNTCQQQSIFLLHCAVRTYTGLIESWIEALLRIHPITVSIECLQHQYSRMLSAYQ